MGIFSSIKEAIFGEDEDKKAGKTFDAKADAKARNKAAIKAAAPESERAATTEVDVERKLDAMDGADNLNWRSSIVDLLKLVGIDPSYENRKELAQEMGDTDYSGKAEENIALHKHVMRKLSDHGGRVPAELK
ncbi:MAG: DUF3597 domain-containing protein [Alteraurantiacibacter sp.]